MQLLIKLNNGFQILLCVITYIGLNSPVDVFLPYVRWFSDNWITSLDEVVTDLYIVITEFCFLRNPLISL